MTNDHDIHHDPNEYLDYLEEIVGVDVENSLANMDDQECLDFTRDFLEMMQRWQPEAINLQEDSVHGAAVSLYLAKLFPKVFRKAYCHSNGIVRTQKQLNRLLDL